MSSSLLRCALGFLALTAVCAHTAYITYADHNTWNGHGSTDIDGDGQPVLTGTADECKASCSDTSNCQCVSFHDGGACFRRSSCNPSNFAGPSTSGDWTVFMQGTSAHTAYITYADHNTWNGHGSTDIDGDGQPVLTGTADECKASCSDTSNCQCVSFHDGGACFRRSSCEPSNFAGPSTSGDWTVFMQDASAHTHTTTTSLEVDGVINLFSDMNATATETDEATGQDLWWLLLAVGVIVAACVIVGCVRCRKGDPPSPQHQAPAHAAEDLTLIKLKEALEGAREQEHAAPDVYLTILEVNVLHKGLRVADLATFSLEGLGCKARIEVTGTAAQLAGMITADAASWALAAIGAGETAVGGALGVTGFGLGEKASAAAIEAQSALAEKAAEGCETKTVDFDVIVDLEKTYGQDAVVARARVEKSSVEAVDTVMSLSLVQGYVEDMLSRRVTAFISSWWRENVPARDEVDDAV